MIKCYNVQDTVRLKAGGPDMLVEETFHEGWVVCSWRIHGETKASAFEVARLEKLIALDA
jgi:uncharacterized protein YodC (DUF2158 family)